MNYRDEAIRKLQAEDKTAKYDRYSQAMHGEVRCALEEFCNQDEEFAQAVVQGGSFEDCMKTVSTKVGQSISDLEAYQRAVSFYFPGAKIRFQMVIDLIGDAAQERRETSPRPTEEAGGLVFDLSAFL